MMNRFQNRRNGIPSYLNGNPNRNSSKIERIEERRRFSDPLAALRFRAFVRRRVWFFGDWRKGDGDRLQCGDDRLGAAEERIVVAGADSRAGRAVGVASHVAEIGDAGQASRKGRCQCLFGLACLSASFDSHV
ncbi:hypothetical protein AAC387_Pa08g0067 [Persea americana]